MSEAQVLYLYLRRRRAGREERTLTWQLVGGAPGLQIRAYMRGLEFLVLESDMYAQHLRGSTCALQGVRHFR